MGSETPDIDFKQIIPRLGSKSASFEELCCQLARREINEPTTRLHGAGGDGGVECYVDTEEGRIGWQAKYTFRIDNLLKQANKSLDAALQLHPTLSRFILCFPFDLTGPTARPGLSGTEKFANWQRDRQQRAACAGRHLTIEAWPAFELRKLLLDQDVSGGLRHFFFGTTMLSDDWFSNHLQRAFKTAGPRYTPVLHVETDLQKWLAAFRRHSRWTVNFETNLSSLASANQNTERLLGETHHDPAWSFHWPEDTREKTKSVVLDTEQVIQSLRPPANLETQEYVTAISILSTMAAELRGIEQIISRDIDIRHGAGTADSPGWRQHMAEYMVSFPAAHLDTVRELANGIESFAGWLRSPECSLAFDQTLVLTGEAGTGKTHGMCDVASRHHEEGLRTCIVFGHEFGNQPSPWSRIAESLGVSPTLGVDQLLDCLDAAGEASGLPLLLCIDAINETKPLRYWRDNLASVVGSIQTRRNLRLCVVCKSTFLKYCLPDDAEYPIVTHQGFSGIERQACQVYFEHFGLRPPILQPELSNPLYLRLVCETLNTQGVDRVPPGWTGGGAAIIREFLSQKDKKFEADVETARSGAATACLMRVVKAIATTGSSSLTWDAACAVIASTTADAEAALTWLVREGLLIEDVSGDRAWEQDSVVRPSFERLGDFLIAAEVLDHVSSNDLQTPAQIDGPLYPWLKDRAAVQAYRGVLGELSILAAEREPGFELPHLAVDPTTKHDLEQITIKGLVFRDPTSLTAATATLVRQALGRPGLAKDAMDAVLTCAWRQSCIDAIWVDDFLGRGPLAVRDQFWSSYLHDRYESGKVVTALISAVDELSVDDIEPDVAERWAIVLLWFTAAADRRIKDFATRSATSILTATPSVIPSIVRRLIRNNDDEVRERALLSCYGALLLSLSSEIASEVALFLYNSYLRTPSDFDNALIRDHIRCMCELSSELSGDPPSDIHSEAITAIPASQNWPLRLPNDEEVEAWGRSLHFLPSEFSSDFFKYSMNCLHPWFHKMPKEEMGKWIIQRAASDFGYVNSDCEHYDNHIIGKYGGGRAKPVWAERIAKKYAWLGLYQLASILNDHVSRQLESWEQEKPRNPLILLEERKLDPTIAARCSERSAGKSIWSFPAPRDLEMPIVTDLERWVEAGSIPSLENMLKEYRYDNNPAMPILAYLEWDGPERHTDTSDVYRQLWVQLRGYLVPAKDMEAAYESLRERNFFGAWLPDGAQYYHGFAGEYPWGTAFNAGDDEFVHGFPYEMPTPLVPSWSEIVCGWEYDASTVTHTIRVPSKRFFDKTLRWDGKGGFRKGDGTSVFLDPSFQTVDPSALLANVEFLDCKLTEMEMGLVWTLVGERRLMNTDFVRNLTADELLPYTTFSQLGWRVDRSNHYADLVVFDNYEENSGPRA